MTEPIRLIDSVSTALVKVIKALLFGYKTPDPLPWAAIARPLATAEDALARLDERLAKSPIRDGWVSRNHFTDACASLWLEGELVHLEDLVLHDAGMDIRAPTHELTRARAVLRARRRIDREKPDWALSPAGLASLRGQDGTGDLDGVGGEEDWSRAGGSDAKEAGDVLEAEEPLALTPRDGRLSEAFAAVDAAIAKADRALASDSRTQMRRATERDPLVYDIDWDEDARLAAWRDSLDEARSLPPTLAAAIAADAWRSIEPLQHRPWLGQLLAAALLRQRGKTRSHLACLFDGLKTIPRERRRSRDTATRLVAELDAITAAAGVGLKAHDRWLNQRALLLRKLTGRRSTSKLPALVDYVLSRPVVSAGMIAEELGITSRAALSLVIELGLREATGRGRYRAWGIL
ncbi:RHE_PE00001 family protein [Bradyrhizobium sp. CCGB12]|uniref:RHE_PE00001 family protein n=1 Tax=Bradyrhizobium sp. CCGB12 TaxID=2949632 RepID=UPI0020B3C3ED|nr:RHE_PE00001 family protein [Bradyrhizobium sp. CCGB12]MCP3395340.1 RHE_PE00001 family protein [Bradyrhizobium sp. CCGB12]